MSQPRVRLRDFLLKSRNLAWDWVNNNIFYFAAYAYTTTASTLNPQSTLQTLKQTSLRHNIYGNNVAADDLDTEDSSQGKQFCGLV